MCTVILGLQVDPLSPVLVAANRDEFRDRPTAPFAEIAAGIWGGRDLRAGGTWFATRKDHAMALLTNIRPSTPPDPARASRGAIVLELLRERTPEEMAVVASAIDPERFNPFHVLFGRGESWYCLRGDATKQLVRLAPGWHVLGNVGLDAPEDPKTAFARAQPLQTHEDLDALLRAPPVWLELGAYGSRWSMIAHHERLWISERGVREAPLVEMPWGSAA